MRMMLKMTLHGDVANKAFREGDLDRTMKNLTEDLKPEASYFYADNGKRTIVYFFDMKDPSQMATISEPLYLKLGAEVDYRPAMNLNDLLKGLDAAKNRY